MEMAPVHARYLVVLQCSVAQLHIAAGETGAAAAIWRRVLRSKTAAAHLPHHVAFEATSLRAPSRPKYARSPRTRSGAAVRRGNPDTGTKERDHLRRSVKPQCRQGGGGQAQPAMHLHLVTGHVRHKASRGGADAKISSFLGLSPLGLFSAWARPGRGKANVIIILGEQHSSYVFKLAFTSMLMLYPPPHSENNKTRHNNKCVCTVPARATHSIH